MYRNYKAIYHGRLLIALIVLSGIFIITLLNYTDFEAYRILKPHQIKANFSSSDTSSFKQLPRAIIIGSRKSGTRALMKFLELNPSIRAAHNEIHFFDDPVNYAKGFEWYKQQMPATTMNQIPIEKSPAYFVTDGAAERIKQMNSSIKLILIMRNPVTRLISDFSQLFTNRFNRVNITNHPRLFDYGSSLDGNETALWKKAEEEFKNYVLRADGGISEQRHAIKIGMYSNYIERWLKIFHKDQLHFVDGEQLITDPYKVLRKTELFLDLKPSITPEQFAFNPRKGFYCIIANQSSSNSRANLEQWIDDDRLICLSKSKGRRHVSVSKELLIQLHEFYEPYNEYLFTLTGIDFKDQKQ